MGSRPFKPRICATRTERDAPPCPKIRRTTQFAKESKDTPTTGLPRSPQIRQSLFSPAKGSIRRAHTQKKSINCGPLFSLTAPLNPRILQKTQQHLDSFLKPGTTLLPPHVTQPTVVTAHVAWKSPKLLKQASRRWHGAKKRTTSPDVQLILHDRQEAHERERTIRPHGKMKQREGKSSNSSPRWRNRTRKP